MIETANLYAKNEEIFHLIHKTGHSSPMLFNKVIDSNDIQHKTFISNAEVR